MGETDKLGWIYDLIQALFKDKSDLETGRISFSTWKQYGYQKWREIQEYLNILAKTGSTDKLRRFCTKLLKDLQFFRTYLRDRMIPMTNNPAEEALRNIVIARKLCFGSQSEYGKRWREVVHSFAETLRRQGKSIMDFLVEVIVSFRQGAPSSSSI